MIDDYNGTKVPFPEEKGSGTLVPKKNGSKIGNGTSVPPSANNMGEAKTSLPKNRYSHLPHIDINGYYQFITFRTHDSIDEYLKKLFATNLENRKKQYQMDEHLDSLPNGAYLNGNILKYLYDFLKSKDGVLYDLVAFVIMSNHIHLLIKPLEKLSVVIQKVKGVSSKEINNILDRKGKFWASDYYDKAIRNERHFLTTYEYIKNNVLKLERSEALALHKDGTEVPFPMSQGSKVLVSHTEGVKVPFPRFYGVYDG